MKQLLAVLDAGMLQCSIGLTCVLWAACSFGQSSPISSTADSTAKVECKSESEEVVLHATASAPLPIVDILPCGAEVTVISKQAGWYRVRTQDGKEGLVKETFLAATSPAEQATRHIKDGYINCDPEANGVHLLASPPATTPAPHESTEALRAIMMVHCGEKIAVLEEIQREHGNWDKIETSGGSVGYLFSGFVSLNPPTAQPQGAAATTTMQAQGYLNRDRAISYATEAIEQLRNTTVDPTSFALLEAVSIEHAGKNSTDYGGCIRYVASDLHGVRTQQWAVYTVNHQGHITMYEQSLWGCYGRGVRTDVTAWVTR